MASSDGSFGSSFRLTLLTNDPAWARSGDDAGVDRIGIDVERLGKRERQRHRPGARLSTHRLDDLRRLAPQVRRARLFCRIDPPHQHTRRQVDRAIDLGATSLMLPSFDTLEQAVTFVEAVDRRAEATLLIETAAAAALVEPLAQVDGVDEIMVGLNDLSWSLGADSRFALLGAPLMRRIASTVRAGDKRFTLGGIGRWDDASLPVDPDLLYAQYPRLGATGAWLARSFVRGLTEETLGDALRSARGRLDYWAGQPPEALEAARGALTARLGPAPATGDGATVVRPSRPCMGGAPP